MKFVLLFLSICLSVSCNSFKEKSKSTINKAGEVVAEAGSEFADGVKKGLKKLLPPRPYFRKNSQRKDCRRGKSSSTVQTVPQTILYRPT